MRYLLTGASGMLGREMMDLLTRHGIDITPAVAQPRPGFITCDFSVTDAVDTLAPHLADGVIHVAALRDPTFCENHSDLTQRINVEAPVRLAERCAKRRLPFLFISTDYVFDGTCPPYHENALVSPLNRYGQSKADAELQILAVHPDATILRVPLLYGLAAGLQQCPLIHGLLRALRSDEPQTLNHTAVRFPTWTGDVAETVHFLMAERAPGIFHISGDEPFTRYEMALVMAEVFDLRPPPLIPDVTPDPTRPQNAQLAVTRLPHLGFTLPSFPFAPRLKTLIH